MEATYSPLVIFLSVERICWNVGLCSGFSCQQLRIKSSIDLPSSDDSGSWGRKGMLSPLRTRFTTSAQKNVTPNRHIHRPRRLSRPAPPPLPQWNSRSFENHTIRHDKFIWFFPVPCRPIVCVCQLVVLCLCILFLYHFLINLFSFFFQGSC